MISDIILLVCSFAVPSALTKEMGGCKVLSPLDSAQAGNIGRDMVGHNKAQSSKGRVEGSDMQMW